MSSIETSPAYAICAAWVKKRLEASPLLLGMGRPWPSSRWQKLRDRGVWIKRDDELSFTLSGPKFRKFCSLQSALLHHRRVVSVGSSRSAFLLGLAQICQEQGFALELYLLKATPYQDYGTDRLYENAFAAHTVHWVERKDWAAVSEQASQNALFQNALFLPEGGACGEALAGGVSLALDIIEQMKRVQAVSEIWIDAGSGFTAQALILGLGTLLIHPPEVHVVLCAGKDEDFARGLAIRQQEVQALLDVPWVPAPYHCHKPPTAAAYGSTNKAVWDTIARVHQDEGILLDPLYTAKLFMSFRAHRQSQSEPSEALVIHSGGGLNNFGFQKGLLVHGESSLSRPAD